MEEKRHRRTEADERIINQPVKQNFEYQLMRDADNTVHPVRAEKSIRGSTK